MKAEGMVGRGQNSGTQPSNNTGLFTELGLQTKLVLAVVETGQPLKLEPHDSPLLALVLSGRATEITEGACIVQGAVLHHDAGQHYVAQTPVEVLQLTDSAQVIAYLRRFALGLYHKDPLTATHSARVGHLAWQLGQALDLGPSRLGELTLAAYLHDIGKLRLPSGILQSPKPLSVVQWQLMMQHPQTGRDLLIGTPLEALGPILEQHHERLDGSGYPHGLKGDEVSLEAYIVAVADTFDAITHTRPYQPVRSVHHALSEINRFSEVLYPSEVVGALNEVSKSLTR